MNNILGKAPKEVADELKAQIHQAFHADSYEGKEDGTAKETGQVRTP